MKRIVIIGAGPAGLSAAYTLLKQNKNYEVIILEQDHIVGGISKTIEFDGYRIDTGIHRFFTKNEQVEKLWTDIIPIQSKPAYDDIKLERKKKYPKTGSDPEREEKSMLIKDRITRIFYGRKFYDYPVNLNWTTISNMGFLTLIKAGCSYLKACILKKPENSLENFYINRFGKVLYSMFFESYTEKVWGIHPSKISADWGSQRVKGVSISEVIKDMIKKIFHQKNKDNTQTSLIEQFIYPKLGAGQVYEEMAREIEAMGGKIIMDSKVVSIKLEDSIIRQVTYFNNNKKKTIDTDICVSSMPIKELIESFCNEKVPSEILSIIKKLPYRDFMSVGLIVDKLKLKNTTKIKTFMDIIPDSWIYIQEKDVQMGRLQVFNNWSPYIFKNKEEMTSKVFISLEYFCSENDKYWNMSDKEFIKFAEKEAIKIGLINPNSIEKAIRIKVPKAYPAYFGTYMQIDQVIDYLNKIDNLYCIGRNGQHRYNNMDHSMLTGIKTAEHILNPITDKKEIWNVNTEKEYHEKK